MTYSQVGLQFIWKCCLNIIRELQPIFFTNWFAAAAELVREFETLRQAVQTFEETQNEDDARPEISKVNDKLSQSITRLSYLDSSPREEIIWQDWLSLPLSLSISLCLSISLYLSRSVSVCLSDSICLSVCLTSSLINFLFQLNCVCVLPVVISVLLFYCVLYLYVCVGVCM